MNWKSLLVLLVIAAAAVWGVLELNKTPDTATKTVTEQALYPDFADKANGIDTLRISKSGGATVAEIKRNGEDWVVSNKNDYPADGDKIRGLLIDLVDAKIVETKTANPEYYERLGVTDISDAKATGTQVELAAGDDKLSLIVGGMASGGSTGTYVRRSGEEQSYLIGSTIALSGDSQQWLKQPIVEIPFERIQRVTIHHPDGETLTLVRDKRDDKNVRIADMPEGRELSYATVANPTASALANLRLEDVIPAAQLKPEDQKEVITAEYETFDGLKLTAKLFKKDDKYYLVPQAAFDAEQAAKFAEPAAGSEASGKEPAAAGSAEQTAETKPAVTDTPTDNAGNEEKPAADKPEDAAATAEAVQKQAEELNERLSDWVYAISEFKYQSMSKRLDDMLKPLEKTQETTEQENQPAAAPGSMFLPPVATPVPPAQDSAATPEQSGTGSGETTRETQQPAAATEETAPAAAETAPADGEDTTPATEEATPATEETTPATEEPAAETGTATEQTDKTQ
jgi:hypothetical protein